MTKPIVALIVTTYERPDYLKRCLDSLAKADLSKINYLIFVDDESKDVEVENLLMPFQESTKAKYPGMMVGIIFKRHAGIKDSLKRGYEQAFRTDDVFVPSDIAINLDADAIVRNDFIDVLLELKERFPDQIVSGFNTTVKNRNPIVAEREDYFEKKYCSGINMVVNREQYEKYIFPSLNELHNWDFESSKKHEADGKTVIVAKPSVVQHIGTGHSAMNHITATEPPDVAEDFKKLHLPNVTLIAADGVNLEEILRVADISCRDIEFGAVKILTHFPSNDPRAVPIRHLKSKSEYSKFILKELADYVDTEYLLIFQTDGYVVNADAWDNDWLQYGYIGAVWEWYNDHKKVGNGGFSLRSKKLHEILRDDPTIIPVNDHLIKNFEEDHVQARIYGDYLTTHHGIKFAPPEVARKFSIEAYAVKPPGNKYNGSFGFHGHRVDFEGSELPHIPYILSELPHGRKQK